jgi:flagellar biogenesis protein FliO
MQNQKSSKRLWKGLVEANLIEGDAPHLELESPWYIKLLLSISGWFGAVFLLIFIGSFLSLTLKINIESFPLLLTFLGAGLTLFSYKMFQSQNSDFLEHFFLAISLAGQVLVVISVVMMWDNKIFDKEIYLFIALGQAFLMWIIPNYIHRVMSSFFMAWAWAFFFYSMGIFLLYVAFLTFVVAWLWMNEFYFESIKKVQAIAYGQLVAMVGLKASTLYADNLSDFYSYSTTNLYFQISPSLIIICSTLTLAYVVWKILEQSNKLEDKKVLLFSFLAVV